MADGRSFSRPGPSPAQPVDRAAPRHKTFEPTTLFTATGEVRAHILNLSATGALIHAADAPGRGERCTVVLAGREIAAEVMWVEGARFGIAFRGALMPDELARLLG
jgi:hypothetical protein